MTHFDAAIVGLGAMGSASAFHLASRGARVLAFDRFAPPHSMGSTHGHTRIIREAYYEHPLYVPLVRRAYELWEALASEARTDLFALTGGLMGGPALGPLVSGARSSAELYGIAHEMLDAAALAARFPAYRAPPDWIALHEHRAGMLFVERCLEAHLTLSRQRGAVHRLNEPVTGWSTSAAGVTLHSGGGAWHADRLVVAAGPWLPELASVLGIPIPLEIERQLSHWFAPASGADDRYKASRCPIGLWEMPDGNVFATLPDEGHGVKCGLHHAGAPTSPGSVNRDVTQAENHAARELLEQVMPGAAGRQIGARVCLYTNTPDRHFIVDWTAGGRVLLVSPCSGHGFKFSSAIGEIVSQLVLDGRTWLDLAPFSLSRFR